MTIEWTSETMDIERYGGQQIVFHEQVKGWDFITGDRKEKQFKGSLEGRQSLRAMNISLSFSLSSRV